MKIHENTNLVLALSSKITERLRNQQTNRCLSGSNVLYKYQSDSVFTSSWHHAIFLNNLENLK